MCNSQSLDYLLMSAMQRLNTKERLQTDRTCVCRGGQRGSAVRLSFYTQDHVAFVMLLYVLCCVVPVQMSLHCC